MSTPLRKLGLIALLIGLCLPVQADLLDSIRQSGKLRAGVAVGVPRFSHLDEQQRLRGSDVDTAMALATDLGIELDIVRISNTDRIKALETRAADIVISSLSITPGRERNIGFTPPYAKPFAVVAAHPQLKISGYADLAGQKIGVTPLTSNASLIDEINHLDAKPALEEKFVQKEFELTIGIPKPEKARREQISNWVIENLRS